MHKVDTRVKSTPLAEPGGGVTTDARYPRRPIAFNFIVFGKDFAKDQVGVSPFWGLRSPVWEIADPPLNTH